jgi:single-strand DNA-binding protein
MNLNQLSIIGFIGKDAETKYLPNGTPVTKFSVATKKSWKDENNEWKEKTQWHNVVAFGKGFEQLADRLVKGAHVFVQGELTTREYDRTIKVSTGKGKSIEHVIQQLVVELKADTIRTLDRRGIRIGAHAPFFIRCRSAQAPRDCLRRQRRKSCSLEIPGRGGIVWVQSRQLPFFSRIAHAAPASRGSPSRVFGPPNFLKAIGRNLFLKIGSPVKAASDPIPWTLVAPRCEHKSCAKGSRRAFPHRRAGGAV